MSAYSYAASIKCDWRDCQSVADVSAPQSYGDLPVPEGWSRLHSLAQMRTAAGIYLMDFCSIHSRMTVTDLAEMAAQR